MEGIKPRQPDANLLPADKPGGGPPGLDDKERAKKQRVRAPRTRKSGRLKSQEEAWNQKQKGKDKADVFLVKQEGAAGSASSRLFIKRGLTPQKINQILPIKLPPANPDPKKQKAPRNEALRTAIVERYASTIVTQMSELLSELEALAGKKDKVQVVARRTADALKAAIGTVKRGDKSLPRELVNAWMAASSSGLVAGDEEIQTQARMARYKQEKLDEAEIKRRLAPAALKKQRQDALLYSLRTMVSFGRDAHENEAYNNDPDRKAKNDAAKKARAEWARDPANKGKKPPNDEKYQVHEKKSGYPPATLTGILMSLYKESENAAAKKSLTTLDTKSLREIALDDKNYPPEKKILAKRERAKAKKERAREAKRDAKEKRDYEYKAQVEAFKARVDEIKKGVDDLLSVIQMQFDKSNKNAKWPYAEDGKTRTMTEEQEATFRALPIDTRPMFFKTRAHRGAFNNLLNRDLKVVCMKLNDLIVGTSGKTVASGSAEAGKDATKEPKAGPTKEVPDIRTVLDGYLNGPLVEVKTGIIGRLLRVGSEKPPLTVAISDMKSQDFERLKKRVGSIEKEYIQLMAKIRTYSQASKEYNAALSNKTPEQMSKESMKGVLYLNSTIDGLMETSWDNLLKEAERARQREADKAAGRAELKGKVDDIELRKPIELARNIFSKAIPVLEAMKFGWMSKGSGPRDQMVERLRGYIAALEEGLKSKVTGELAKTRDEAQKFMDDWDRHISTGMLQLAAGAPEMEAKLNEIDPARLKRKAK